MNGTVNRRVFVGSLAGAGVGALGATSLDLSLSAQPAPTSPLLREIRGQLKEALGKMQNGQAAGARQAATVLRVYASTVNDGQLQGLLKKANRQQLVVTEMNHGELVRQAKELGIDPSTLPPHTLDRVGREAALERLIKEGCVSVHAQRCGLRRWGRGEDGTRGASVWWRAWRCRLRFASQFLNPGGCGDCERERQQVDALLNIATVICAASIIFPLLLEACAAVTAAYLTFYMAYGACLAIVAFCEAYYHL